MAVLPGETIVPAREHPYHAFAANLRGLRIAAHLSSSALAETVGVRPSAMRDWEEGSGLPDVPCLLRLATRLSCSVEQLVAGLDSPYDAGRTAHSARVRALKAELAACRAALGKVRVLTREALASLAGRGPSNA